MKRTTAWIVLLVLVIGSVAPTSAASAFGNNAAPLATPPAQGDPPSNSKGDPNDIFMSYSVSGVDLSGDTVQDWTVDGWITGNVVTFSGKMVVTVPEGLVSHVKLSAYFGEQTAKWPPEGESGEVRGRTVELPFDFSFQVPPGFEAPYVLGGAQALKCGGICAQYDLTFIARMPEPTPTPTPPPQPKPPCEDAAWYYPNLDLNEYFTGQPALNFTGSEMSYDLVNGLNRYVQEGNEVVDDVWDANAPIIATTYATSFIDTGKQTALQEAARQMAREKQKDDPSYRLTPGDLFYLSLRTTNGNVLDALLTCHAALYRDGGGVNKKFVEEENILVPLRNPEGYPDRETTYTTPRGSSRTINPHRELGEENQGPWYHLFGTTALEFSDRRGVASFWAAWSAVKWLPESWGGLPENFKAKVLAPDFQFHELNSELGKLAIALEDSVRSNMGKPPDMAKYCINYYGLEAGRALKLAMQDIDRSRPVNIIEQNFRNLEHPTEAVNIYGEILKKSPLSIYIEGTGGEWFSLDQRSGIVNANTPLIYFELFPEEDGTLAFYGVPFFEVASVQMTGTGDGPATVALWDRASETGSIYQFEVQDGDEFRAEGLTGVPLLNGNPLEPSGQTAGDVVGGSDQTDGLLSGLSLPWGALLVIGGGGLLALLLIGSAVILGVRRSGRKPGPSTPPPGPAPHGATAACPYCGAAVSLNAGFCHACRRPLAAAVPAPSYTSAQLPHEPAATRQTYPPPQAMAGQPGAAGSDSCHACGQSLLPGTKFCISCGTPQASPSGGNACRVCGQSLAPGTRFCSACGTPQTTAPQTTVPQATTPQPAMPRPAPSPVPAVPAEPVVGIVAAIERRKGLLGSESYNLVLTPQRLVFARLTSEMLREVAQWAKESAKDEGKGFFGQWRASLGANSAICERYTRMPVEAILAEHPDNFSIPVQQVRRVRVRRNFDDEQVRPDELVIHAAEKMRFALKGTTASQAKKALQQVLGKIVK